MTHSERIQRLRTFGSDEKVALGGVRQDHSGTGTEEYDALRVDCILSHNRKVWKATGISRLKIEGVISMRWREVFEAAALRTSKYTS